MFRFHLSAILFFLTSTLSFSQSIDSMSVLIKEIQRGKNDSVRFASNEIFLNSFEKTLLEKNSFTRNFDSLKNISVQSPDNNKFRIYTWAVPHYNGQAYDYFGFIQLHSDTGDLLVRLTDSSDVIQKPESEKLNPSRWLGAVYYSILTLKKSGKIYYTLLGWKGKDQKQTQKVIEILFIDGIHVKFGFPLIKMGSIFRNRVVFSFNAQTSMTLHFDKKYNGIVFDHFSTNKNNPTELNGPDGTYDALKILDGKWILFNNVKVGTKWEPRENLPQPPEHK